MPMSATRQGLLPWRPSRFHVEQTIARNRRAIEFVEMRRRGMSVGEIAATQNCAPQWIYQILLAACPPFRTPPAPKIGAPPAKRPLGRPAWSYPDADLLRIAREGRQEILAAEAYLRVVRRRPHLRPKS
jgi:hypothetical protein